MRFYVYRLFSADGLTQYVGKGSGRRLLYQRWKFKLGGEIIARFKRERDAYAFEIKQIAELKPLLNKHPGGNGSRATVVRVRRMQWEIDIERLGSRVYAARALLKFDLRAYLPIAKIEALRAVACGI